MGKKEIIFSQTKISKLLMKKRVLQIAAMAMATWLGANHVHAQNNHVLTGYRPLLPASH